MAIKSHAFGRVTLTGDEARKFRNQMAHGKPKAAAVAGLKRSVEMSRSFRKNGGKLTLKLKRG
jgi:hypothetical protein